MKYFCDACREWLHASTRDELARYDIGRLNPASDYARQFPAQQAADGPRFPTLAQVLALGAGFAGVASIASFLRLMPSDPIPLR